MELEGEYDAYRTDDVRIEGDRVNLKYRHGGILDTSAKSATGEWRGEITMSKDSPQSGQGYFDHVDRPECGTHQIFIDKLHERIVVKFTNMSHAGDIPKSGAYYWKRIAPRRSPISIATGGRVIREENLCGSSEGEA